VGGLSSSEYVGDKSESSEIKRGCDIAIGNSCNLALAVELSRRMHVLIGATNCCHSRVEVDNFTCRVGNLASMVYIT
jgi:hypothetical protein